jgi:hypothetical protein
MKRRDFLASLVAGATVAVLPTNLLASTNVWNAATLTGMLEKMFACQMGPPVAFFEVTAAGKILTPNEKLSVPINRYTYETYVAAVKGGTAEEAEAKLAQHFYEQFSKVPAGQLVWRTQPTFSSHEVVEFGDTWMTSEAIEDSTEEAPFMPAGVEYDFATGNYRFVKEKYTLHKMRMRLVLPDVYDEEVPAIASLFKPEGSPVVANVV